MLLRPIWTLLYTLPHPTFFLGRRHLSLSPLVRPGVRRLAPPNTQDSPFPLALSSLGSPLSTVTPPKGDFQPLEEFQEEKENTAKKIIKVFVCFHAGGLGGAKWTSLSPPFTGSHHPAPFLLRLSLPLSRNMPHVLLALTSLPPTGSGLSSLRHPQVPDRPAGRKRSFPRSPPFGSLCRPHQNLQSGVGRLLFRTLSWTRTLCPGLFPAAWAICISP